MQRKRRPVIAYRQKCPGCHSDMMFMRKYQTGARRWGDVWFCMTCRRELVVDEDEQKD